MMHLLPVGAHDGVTEIMFGSSCHLFHVRAVKHELMLVARNVGVAFVHTSIMLWYTCLDKSDTVLHS